MSDFWQFLRSVWNQSVYLLTSSALAALLMLWEHFRGEAAHNSLFLTIIALILIWACFRAWRDERRERTKIESELSRARATLEAQRSKSNLEEAEAELAEARLGELAAQKKRREEEEQRAERMDFLTAPDTGIRYYVNQVTEARHLSTMPFTVEKLVEALSATQSEIEDALLLLRSRGFAKETSLPGHWFIH